jgi:hypothetical protein
MIESSPKPVDKSFIGTLLRMLQVRPTKSGPGLFRFPGVVPSLSWQVQVASHRRYLKISRFCSLHRAVSRLFVFL